MQEAILSPYRNKACPMEVRRDFARVLDPNHIHNFLQIFFVNDGFYTHYIGDTSLTLHAGALAIIPSACPHYGDARHAENDLFFCNLSDRLFACDARNPWNFHSLCLTPLGDAAQKHYPFLHPRTAAAGEIGRLYGELYDGTTLRRDTPLPILRGKTVEVLALVASEYDVCEHRLKGSAMSDYCPSLHAALHHIHANFRSDLRAEDAAKASMLSVRSFYRLFGGCMGMGFHDYVRLLRLDHAKTLLRTTDRILPDIARDAGFADLANFHRTFHRHTGRTPRAYRTAAQGLQ